VSITEFGHEELGRTTKCIFELADDFLSILAFIFYRINFATDSAVFKLDAWRRVDHSDGGAFARTFLGHQVGDDLIGGVGGVVLGGDTNEVSSLSDVPDCFIPVVLFDEA